MSFVALVRRLWSRRKYLIVVLVCACLGGMAIELRSHRYDVGIASASALIDSTGSQVADLGAGGGDPGTLAGRASLLASVITGAPMKDQIARLAGVAPGTLIANPPKVAGSAISPAPPIPNAPIKPSDPRASVLDVSVVNAGQGIQLPIIQVDTQAPTAAMAARLANASFTALEANVNSLAASNKVPAQSRLVIRPLGAASSASDPRGTGPLAGVLVGGLLFVLGCGAILGIPWLRTAWRRADEIEDRAPPATGASIVRDFPAAGRGERAAKTAFVEDASWEGPAQAEGTPFDAETPVGGTLANDLWSARSRKLAGSERGERA